MFAANRQPLSTMTSYWGKDVEAMKVSMAKPIVQCKSKKGGDPPGDDGGDDGSDTSGQENLTSRMARGPTATAAKEAIPILEGGLAI